MTTAGFTGLLARLDSRADTRGRQFELICQWFLRNAPAYRSRLREVWLWDEWPGNWGRDAGIDLVAETTDGELWAVQAKCYDPDYSVTKADVDSFLSESSRTLPDGRGFAYRLLLATTDRVGKTAQVTMASQAVPVGWLLRSQLAVEQVEWPSSPHDLVPVAAAGKEPREHQREAIDAALAGLNDADRGQMIMACGTGKTLVGLWIAEQAGSERVCVVLPSLSLLAQTLREWTANAREPLPYLAVCSDETVTNRDAVVATTSELGVPVTTDPQVVNTFLRDGRDGELRVVFSTYQSTPQLAEAHAQGAPGFDLLLADEAHRCAGPKAGVFATVLDQEKIPASKRLFMTATPRYFTGSVKKQAQEAEFEVASMDDEQDFGRVLHRLTFGEAIERDLLSDYQVVVVGVTDSLYRDYAEKGTFVTRDGETITDARTLASQLGLLRTMQKYDLHRVVSFHSRVNNASAFANSITDVLDWLPDQRRPAGELWTQHVSGKMSSGQRDRHLTHLRQLQPDQRGLLSNARCLGEGVDVPTLDGVAFIDPKRSQVDIVQAVGRAIRKAEDKTLGTIIIPVFIDENSDPEDALEGSAFDHVWQVLKALRDHDQELADELDEIRRELGRRKTSARRPAKIVLDTPVSIGERFAQAFDAMLVRETTTSWEFWYGVLERFADEHGHARVPAKHVSRDGFKLGVWVNSQRTNHQKGQLDTERGKRLEQVLGWTWDIRRDVWEDGFRQLKTFVERHGHSRVRQKHQSEDGFKLGVWVNSQRTKYAKNQLDPERACRLEATPGWTWDPRSDEWEDGLRRLRRFADEHGHSRVPYDFVTRDGFGLGVWASAQRQQLGRLAADRKRRLEELPDWRWEVEDAWKVGFEHLQEFIDEHGHSRVPGGFSNQDGHGLGDWVKNQRRAYERGDLDPDRATQLSDLPGWVWSVRESAWEEGFEHLRTFMTEHGHSRVPQRFKNEDGFRLGTWVSKQRDRRASLDEGQQRRLENLPAWTWHARAETWEDGFNRLLRFADSNGHTRVPQSYADGEGFELGQWVSGQRSAHQRGTLANERTRLLEDLPEWAWNARDAAWEEAFARLATYVDRAGTAAVPSTHVEAGHKLGRWVIKQRQAFKEQRLDPERKRRLESLSGWVWTTR